MLSMKISSCLSASAPTFSFTPSSACRPRKKRTSSATSPGGTPANTSSRSAARRANSAGCVTTATRSRSGVATGRASHGGGAVLFHAKTSAPRRGCPGLRGRRRASPPRSASAQTAATARSSGPRRGVRMTAMEMGQRGARRGRAGVPYH
jgi:hypothetical protein